MKGMGLRASVAQPLRNNCHTRFVTGKQAGVTINFIVFRSLATKVKTGFAFARLIEKIACVNFATIGLGVSAVAGIPQKKERHNGRSPEFTIFEKTISWHRFP